MYLCVDSYRSGEKHSQSLILSVRYLPCWRMVSSLNRSSYDRSRLLNYHSTTVQPSTLLLLLLLATTEHEILYRFAIGFIFLNVDVVVRKDISSERSAPD